MTAQLIFVLGFSYAIKSVFLSAHLILVWDDYISGVTQLFDEVCFHCGDTEVEDSEEIRRIKEGHSIVRPICEACHVAGKPIKTRNALKTKKRK